MDERYEKLLAEAFFDEAADQADTKVYELNDAIVQKFAELIVEDCLFKIRVEAAQYLSPDWRDNLVNNIKDHFGVKE